MDNSELQQRHFSVLKEKYQVGQCKSNMPNTLTII